MQIFRGARDGWNLDYFRRRLLVGQIHDRIDLPCKWYAGSYTEYHHLACEMLAAELQDPEERAVDLSRHASEVIEKLGTSSREIEGVTRITGRIASQSNLLALNATIEAAHSGGFAVVAGEVKVLANETA